MKFLTVKFPKFANKEKTSIDCEVTVQGIASSFIFHATPNDVEAHGVELYNKCVSGAFGEVAEFTPRKTAA